MRLASPFHPQHTRLVWTILILLGLITVISVALWLWGPPFFPLWYSQVNPEDQLASSASLLSLPLLGALITAVTLWYGKKSHLEHELYLATLSLWSGVFLLTMLGVALLRILKITI